MTQVTLPSRKRLQRKNCYQVTANIRDVLKFYKNKYGTPSKGGCNQKIARAVLREFNSFIADQIVRGEKVVLPYSLGYIEVIRKRKRLDIKEDGKIFKKHLMVDWPRTWEYWKTNPKAASEKKILYYINEHSDGYSYFVHWGKYGVPIKHIGIYSFRAARNISRKLAEHLLNPDTDKNYNEKC